MGSSKELPPPDRGMRGGLDPALAKGLHHVLYPYVAVFLGKTLNAIFHLEDKQSTRCGGPA